MIALLIALHLPEPSTSWLTGYWLSCEDGREVSETWSDLRNGVMANTTITVAGGETTVETARIERGAEGGFSFVARSEGQPQTEFALTDYSDSYGTTDRPDHEAVFSNPSHDFPQRVIYSRTGDVLTARIEGEVDGRVQTISWRYVKAELNARCPAS